MDPKSNQVQPMDQQLNNQGQHQALDQLPPAPFSQFNNQAQPPPYGFVPPYNNTSMEYPSPPSQYTAGQFGIQGQPPPFGNTFPYNTTYPPVPYQQPLGFAQNPYYPPTSFPHNQQQSTVVVLGQQQTHALSRPFISFVWPILLSCCVFWFCGIIFGLIAFIIAVVGSGSTHDTTRRNLYNASCGVSIAGIIVAVILIIVLGSVLGSLASKGSSSSSSSYQHTCAYFSEMSCSSTYGYYYDSYGCGHCCYSYSYNSQCSSYNYG